MTSRWTVGNGELVCLLGPSGSAKSTLLRMCGGFERPTTGRIAIDGQDVTAMPPETPPDGDGVPKPRALDPHERVPQPRLRPETAPPCLRPRSATGSRRCSIWWALRAMAPAASRKLSGGQQQRVALARSLVLEPKILLLDETLCQPGPAPARTPAGRGEGHPATSWHHDTFRHAWSDEALAMADRIVVMRDGRTEQIDAPDVVYRDPRTPFVAGFIGTMNLIDGAVAGGRLCPRRAGRGRAGQRRPRDPGHKARGADPAPGRPGQARVHRVTDFGSHGVVDIDLSDGFRLKAMVPDPAVFRPGQGG